MNNKLSQPDKFNDSDQVCILVIGMHRSGTSVMTRLLNLHGVSLGQDLLGASVDNNVRGFWEKRAVMKMHEQLLAELGRSWHDPRPLPLDWLKSKAAGRAIQKIHRILDEFANKNIFAIKDPRICQFIELWLPILVERKIRPVALFVFRHPLEVAESLRRRDGWPYEMSWLLWFRSMIEPVICTSSLQRCVVSYSSLMSGDWQDSMERIEKIFDLRWPVSSKGAADKVLEYIDTNEWHNRQTMIETKSKIKVPHFIHDVHQAFLDVQSGASWSLLDGFVREKADFDTSTVPLYEDKPLQLTDAVQRADTNIFEREVGQLSHQLSVRDQKYEELAKQIHAMKVDADALAASKLERAKLKREIKSLSSRLHRRDQKIEKLSKQVNAMTSDLDELDAVRKTNFNLRSSVKTLKGQIIQQDHKIATVVREHEKNERSRLQMIKEMKIHAWELSDIRNVHKSELKQKETEIAELNSTIEDVFQSKSWKLTTPIRLAGPALLTLLSRLRFPQSKPNPEPSSIDTVIGSNAGTVPKLNSFSKKILLISYYCPTRAHAGGLRILDIYTYLKSTNPLLQVDLYTHGRPDIDWSIEECNAIFDNVYLAPTEILNLNDLIALGCKESYYDVIDLQFHQTGGLIDEFRGLGGKILFTPMEAAVRVFLLGIKKFFSDAAIDPQRRALDDALDEIKFCRKVDEVVCVSENDASVLRRVSGATKVTGLETGLSMVEFGDALACKPSKLSAKLENHRVLYMAYFGSQTNVDALKWYLDKVHPLVRQKIPQYKLTVIGRGDMTPFESYSDTSINFVGEVPKLGPFIKETAIGIAPALSGSGFRGKVNQYALFGVPCVVSPISLKGLAYKDKEDIFVAKSARNFAKACVNLLLDVDLRNRVGEAAYERCISQYTWASKDDQLSDIYRVPKNMVEGERLVSVLVPSYNHGAYLRQRIESILAQTHKNIELIVIDDMSQDNSNDVIQEMLEVANFRYIKNKTNSGTPFAAWEKVAKIAKGDFIWVCESDDFAEPSFLKTAVEAMQNEDSAAVYYCNSWVVDEVGKRIGGTEEYFTDTWQESRWNSGFTTEGYDELANFQQYGQVVPNMSSALIKSEAFRDSYSAFLKRFKLTGDWLFIGWLMNHGRVIFDPSHLSNFRKHQVTSRVRVQSARSQAEFVLTKYLLFKCTGKRTRELSSVLTNDAVRFAYEPARWYEVAAAMLRVSWVETIKCGVTLAVSVAMNPGLIREFRSRLDHSKGLIR